MFLHWKGSQKFSNYFCVSDKLCEPPKDSPQYDKLYKVRPVLEQIELSVSPLLQG